MITKKLLQIQALGLALLLGAQDALAGGAEVGHLDAHAALAQGEQAGLGADGLDVGAREVVLLGDELVEVDVLVEAHLAGVEVEDLALRVLVRVLEQDLAVDAPRADQRRVQRLDLVGRHDHLDVAPVVEAVQLVEQLQHGPLHLALSPRCRIISFRTNSVDLVNEDNRGGVLAGNL